MLIGYARVSTADQNLQLQEDALKLAGCINIHTDVASGSKTDRPGLTTAINYLREGDVLVVWKLDRLGRSLIHLIETVQSLNARGIGFKSLQENIDTTSSGGKLIFHMFSALAEFERDLIRERTHAGLKSARARGRVGGRPKSLNGGQVSRVFELYENGETTVKEICKLHNISKATLYNYKKGQLGSAKETTN